MITLHQPRPPVASQLTAGPAWHQATSTELTLERHGAVIDLAAVERAINGITTDLNDAEQYEAARLLDQLGYQPLAIAERTGMNVRRVARWKAAGWPEQRPDNTRGLRRGTPAPT